MNQFQELYQSLWLTHVIWHNVQHENFYHLFENKNILFLVEEVFWLAYSSFYLIISVLVLFLQMLGYLVKWHCDYFYWSLKLLSIIVNINICNWILIVFGTVCKLFFNGVSRCLMYISSGSRQCSVSGWWFLVSYQCFIFCVLTLWNWDRDYKKISSNVMSLSVLFAKFVKSADSVGHNGMSNFILFCV